MNDATKLPDAYVKSTESNMYNFLQLANSIYTDNKNDLLSIDSVRSIHDANGKTLDRYGEMLGVLRNGTTDNKYRTRIMLKAAQNLTDADCNSIINSIARIVNVEPSSITIVEHREGVDTVFGNVPVLNVAVIGLTLEMLETSGFTSEEVSEMIKQLMPVGVKLLQPYYAGTLLLSETTGAIAPDGYYRLFYAWLEGQKALAEGRQVGLKGNGTVPEEFAKRYKDYQTTGYYEGGTLGILSGD